MHNMAIVKATYTRNKTAAKATIRYIEHRPGRDGAKSNRVLFNSDGLLGRYQAYRMIDEAAPGGFFYRIIVSPDPTREDSERDLFLREITQQTMLSLEEQLARPLSWVAVEHADHAPHRHIHVLALVPSKLHVSDFQAMRARATGTALAQRRERDLAREHQAREREEAQWEREY